MIIMLVRFCRTQWNLRNEKNQKETEIIFLWRTPISKVISVSFVFRTISREDGNHEAYTRRNAP